MVFYDGITYIHKLLDFKRVCGKFAFSLGIYIGTLYTCHLALGVVLISALSMLYIGVAFRLVFAFRFVDGFHRAACVLLLFINFFPKNIKK